MFGILAVLLMLPAVFGPAMSHDSFWIDRVWSEQFTALLRTGRLYPRWLPWSYGGLGAPVFYFYAPLSFHLTGLFGLLGLPTYAALLAAFGAAWFASGVTMYAWLKPRAAAPLIGATLYMVLPYHLIDFYGRGALAEFCAFALVPLVAMSVCRALDSGRAIPLAFAYAALIMTHLPTAVIVSVLLIAPLSLWGSRRAPMKLLAVTRGVLAGFAAAAIYLLPALTLQRYSSVGALWAVKFLKPASWSLLHPELWTSTSYVLLFAGLAGAVALAALILMRSAWRFWPCWTIAICVISAGLVPGFWSLPALSAVQFPWRSLVLAEFGLATVIAGYRGSPVLAAAVIAPLLAFSLLMATTANPMHGEPMQPLPIPGRQDVIEYLPPGAVGAERAPRLDTIRQAVAAAHIRRASVFAFPSLQSRCANGQVRPLVRDPRSPLLAAPARGCTLSVEYLTVEQIGFFISLLSWIGLTFAAGRNLIVRNRQA